MIEASSARAQFMCVGPDLEPYLKAVQAIVNAGRHEQPDLPVAILPHLLLGDKESAWDADRLSWEDFRTKVLGETDPSGAAAGRDDIEE